MAEAYIFDAVRTPRGIGKPKGALYPIRPTQLMVTVLQALAKRNELDTREIDDVVVGCVTQTSEQGTCPARYAAMEAGYHHDVPAMTLNRYCASGLQAVNQAAAMIQAGHSDLIVAGGMESMSRVPMGSDVGNLFDPAAQQRVGSVPQGISADLLATLNGITREEADRLSFESHQRAVKATSQGKFQKSLVPVHMPDGSLALATDENPRPDTSLEKLSTLNPAFEVLGRKVGLDSLVRRTYPQIDRINHIHTAGNSSAIVDGAAAVLVGSLDKGKALGLKPRARIVAQASSGSEPLLMLAGPLPSTRKALAKAKMGPGDMELIEINEAFAAVALLVMRTFEWDPSRVNIHGGAIAMGHPLGATGAMILSTLLDALEETGKGLGLVTLCVAGGMGTTTIIERV